MWMFLFACTCLYKCIKPVFAWLNLVSYIWVEIERERESRERER